MIRLLTMTLFDTIAQCGSVISNSDYLWLSKDFKELRMLSLIDYFLIKLSLTFMETELRPIEGS